MNPVTIDQLAKATGASEANAKKFYPWLLQAMRQFDINTARRQAQFLATVGVESARMTTTEEDLYYRDAARLARIYPRAFKTPVDAKPYVANAKALGQLLYQGYWGRGLIQLTWLKNYQAAQDALGQKYVDMPDVVTTPAHAALTAAWYWATNGCNQMADRDTAGTMEAVTRAVNGSAMLHLKERKALFEVAMRALV